MKKLLLIVGLSLIVGAACATTYLPLTGAGSVIVTSTYTGPGDVVSGALAWYSCSRGYNAAYSTGSNAGCNIVRASDSHTCDVLIATGGAAGNTANCSTGGDNGQSASSFCNATTCAVTKAYDQSGASSCTTACDIKQTTAADQPALLFSCVGTTFCMEVTSSVMFLQSTATLAASHGLPISGSSVSEYAPGAGDGILMATSNSGDVQFYYAGLNQTNIYNGASMNASYTDATIVAINEVANSGASAAVINIDGTETTGTISTGSISSAKTISVFMDSFGNSGHNVMISETGLWGSGFTGTQRTNLCKNQQAFYVAGNFGAAC